MSIECRVTIWSKSYIITTQDDAEAMRIAKAAELLDEHIQEVSRSMKTARDAQVILFAALHALNQVMSKESAGEEYLQALNELASEMDAASSDSL